MTRLMNVICLLIVIMVVSSCAPVNVVSINSIADYKIEKKSLGFSTIKNTFKILCKSKIKGEVTFARSNDVYWFTNNSGDNKLAIVYGENLMSGPFEYKLQVEPEFEVFFIRNSILHKIGENTYLDVMNSSISISAVEENHSLMSYIQEAVQITKSIAKRPFYIYEVEAAQSPKEDGVEKSKDAVAVHDQLSQLLNKNLDKIVKR